MNEYAVLMLVVLMVAVPFVLGWLAGTTMRWLDQSRCVREALRARDNALTRARWAEGMVAYREEEIEDLKEQVQSAETDLILARSHSTTASLRGLVRGGE